MRMRIGLALLVVVSLTFLIAAATGRLSGAITDRSGSVMPGVRVTVSGPQRASTVTDRHGRYRFLGLLPGHYTVTAELRGFNTAQSALEVKEGAEANWSPTIEVASLAESVTVAGASPGGDKPETQAVTGAGIAAGLGDAAGGTLSMSAGDLASWLGARRSAEGYAPISENPFRRVSARWMSALPGAGVDDNRDAILSSERVGEHAHRRLDQRQLVLGLHRPYENRMLQSEDFNDDRKDAGEMGAGHT